VQAPSSWPRIDGVDEAPVRKVLRDDFAHFTRLCAHLLAQADDVRAELHALPADAKPDAALRSLHGLRGAALTLGARRLGMAVVPLEAALRAAEPADAPLQAFEAELSALRQALAPWLPAGRG
jgi:HPt (histidine-containing phosphotransfer) domain-containing protein